VTMWLIKKRPSSFEVAVIGIIPVIGAIVWSKHLVRGLVPAGAERTPRDDGDAESIVETWKQA